MMEMGFRTRKAEIARRTSDDMLFDCTCSAWRALKSYRNLID